MQLMTAESMQVSCHSQAAGSGDSDVGAGQGLDVTPASPLSRASSCSHRESWVRSQLSVWSGEDRAARRHRHA